MRMAILAGLVVLLAGCGAGEHSSLSGPLTVRDNAKTVKLTGKELDALASDLEAADLGSVRSDSTSERPIPDAFGYRVSYAGDTVTTDSAAMPKKLRGLVSRLGGLVDRYAK